MRPSVTRALHAVLLLAMLASAAPWADAATQSPPSPLLAIDRNRDTVVERIVAQWGDALARANAGIDGEQLRTLLLAMRADQLLAASLAGSLDGLRNVVAAALVSEADVKPSLLQAKALGDANQDVVYVPVTPCRLVETRGTFAAVYQGGGPFTTNQVRTYTLQGGNGVCLTQLPASASPSAIQMQVYGIPTSTGSGDIEILPQGGTFGSTATLVYLGNNAFTSSSATSLANLANKQISVQVRGGGAHVAIDVVGYFRAPAGGYVSSVTAGAGLTGGTITSSGTIAVDMTAVQARVGGTCPLGSSIRVIGADGAVTCQVDGVGTGTVTSVGSGTGLTGGPITSSGTLSADTTFLQRRVSSTCAVGSSIRAIAADGSVTCQTDNAGPVNAFVNNGNAFGGVATLATTDNFAMQIEANNDRVVRLEPNAISPNVIIGSSANGVNAGVRGATIGGGGAAAGTDVTFATSGPNRVTDAYGTVGGGYSNRAGDNGGTTTDSASATVAGGHDNVASGSRSFVGGGSNNNATGSASTVGGGGQNDATEDYATVGGGDQNIAAGISSTAAGGFGNQANSSYSFIGGGFHNIVGASRGTISGGQDNVVSGAHSTIGGGDSNQVLAPDGTVAGGFGNIVMTGQYATVGGGLTNLASGGSAVVAGGRDNSATIAYSTVSGGIGNTASGNSGSVGGGDGNLASGTWSVVSGGRDNIAGGDYSVALGRRARTLGNGSFQFADSNNFDFESSSTNAFRVRATGGVRFVVDIDGAGATTWSCLLTAGNSWGCSSDRNLKQDLSPLDGTDVLDKLVAMPIYAWSPKGRNSHVRHFGPMAQDFHAAFGLGDDDKLIGMQDADGVALAAIKGLNHKVQEQAREIGELRRALDELIGQRRSM